MTVMVPVRVIPAAVASGPPQELPAMPVANPRRTRIAVKTGEEASQTRPRWAGSPRRAPSRPGAIPGAAAWEARFALLCAYVDREGNARVPQGHTEEGVRLGRWVNRQREAHSAGQLAEERVAALEALPGWVWNAYSSAWESRFEALASWVERTGDARVPRNLVVDDIPVTGWVARQREAYRQGTLSNDRVARLEALPGWQWGTRP